LRPLLRVRRAALRDYLRERGAAWRIDASNADLSLPRNRLRAEVVPVLERVQAGAAVKLAQLAELARGWTAPRRAAWEEALEAAVEAGEGGEWLSLEVLIGAPQAERRALLAAWLRGSVARLSRPHVERAADLAERGPVGRSLSLPGDRVLFRDRDALWLGPAPGPRFPEPLDRWLDPPRGLECAERDLRLEWRALGPDPSVLEGWAVARGSRVRVRSPQPGDAIRITAGGAPRPLRELFARSAWPRRRRARSVVVEHDGRVVWVPGLALATPAHALRHGWKLVIGRLSTPGDSC
jgi:tRNA(Ile)-lysidine synthase